MYSDTPPENVTTSGGASLRSGSSRSSAAVASLGERRDAASISRSARRSTRRCTPSGSGTSPMSSASPTSAANRRPASSMRITRPSASNATMRAPTSIAVMSTTSPASHTAIFDVPPPMSRFMTRQRSRMERAAAPEPNAASVVSSASPALTDTNLPAWSAKRSAIARALRRRTATPVRMRAPVSMVAGTIPAASYCAVMKAPSAAASIAPSATYGVSSTSDSCRISRCETM